jgi:hypothetical protein
LFIRTPEAMRELNTTGVTHCSDKSGSRCITKAIQGHTFLNVLDALEVQVFRAESAELIHHFLNGAKLVHTWEAPCDYCLHIPARRSCYLPSLVCSAWSLIVNGEVKTLHIWSDCRGGSLKVNKSPPNTLQFLSV